MTIAKYIRLSLEDSKSDSQSIENQRLLLDTYLQSTDVGNTEILEFVDNGYSGTNFNRPAIQSLLSLVQERKIDCILVKDFSRFGRNALEMGYYLERIFPLYGVRFLSLADGYDSQDYGEDTGGLLVSFKFLMAEYYSKDLSQKITSAARERMKRGERISKRCAFGYRKEGNNLVPDEATAPTVQRIFQLAQQGESTRSIVQTLYREQHFIPTVYRGERPVDDTAYIWNASVIGAILRNEQYTGTYVSGTTKVEGFGSKRRVPTPESEWIKIPDHHPAIITQSQFDMVQAIWKQSRKPRGTSAHSATKPSSHLSGKVYCGHCGHKLREYNGKTSYFGCKFTAHIPDSPCHKLKAITAALEKVVYEELVRHINSHASTAQPVKVMQTPDKAQSLYEAFVSGQIDAQTYQSLKALTDKPHSKKKEHSSQGECYTLKEKSLTRALVEEWIEKVFYFPDGHIEVQWRELVTGKTQSK
ncbi:recombinase family protein [Bengtsoniella intestinalis]|uniref:recombinase family protein n=1 Tax=Bengtsoniella intestinalis TaxID=3073143 RepID=UPI00391F8BC5